jgi:hypothetical protein
MQAEIRGQDKLLDTPTSFRRAVGEEPAGCFEQGGKRFAWRIRRNKNRSFDSDSIRTESDQFADLFPALLA